MSPFFYIIIRSCIYISLCYAAFCVNVLCYAQRCVFCFVWRRQIDWAWLVISCCYRGTVSCLCLQRAPTVYVYSFVWGSVELMYFCIIESIYLVFWSPNVSVHSCSPYLYVDSDCYHGFLFCCSCRQRNCHRKARTTEQESLTSVDCVMGYNYRLLLCAPCRCTTSIRPVVRLAILVLRLLLRKLAYFSNRKSAKYVSMPTYTLSRFHS